MTQTEAIQQTINERNKVRLANLTPEQKDAFILEKMNNADAKMLDIIEQTADNYEQTFQIIKAELMLGVEMPENPTVSDILKVAKPFLELIFERKMQEMKEWEGLDYHQMRPQPVKITR